jgi:hypothetical protein
MIHRKQIIFLKSMTGVLSILIISTSSLASNTNPALEISDLRILGKQFQDGNKPFLSYIFNLCFYHLTADSAEKLHAAFDALSSCIITEHFHEASTIIEQLTMDFPHLSEKLKYLYGYSLLSMGRFTEGDLYLRELENHDEFRTRVLFLRAYVKLNTNQPGECSKYLEEIYKDEFPYSESLEELQISLKKGPKGIPKYKTIAVLLSAILPGAGQAYAGFYFDAIQSFGFNLALGCGSYAAWRHELDHPREKRNYILPVITTGIWGTFYFVNLYNAANVSQKANLYRDNVYYSRILERFQVVIEDEKYFLNIGIDF